ncbi:unnamed protein product [Lepeophtheirus salmonis]|uniref:(salmon louse) hypothetical protein n=1 Tax=Lepeophtheirus salmonis TaxID=72036 RepID=A0A7R8CQ05_LEPSM|nr:unnamed protein product [Lepeophtheirus salmonis]CAF2890818.1 unnamed protein product [Lepeophtheirus salmonis]
MDGDVSIQNTWLYHQKNRKHISQLEFRRSISSTLIIQACVVASLQKMGIEDFRKCISLCTDGAPSMIGCHNGLIAKVREFKPDIIAVHSIIHQENLNDKFDNMDHVNSVVVTTVSDIRSRGLNHR